MKGKIILKPLLFISFLVACLMLNAQGYISETIQHDGLIREYSIYVPASYDGTTNFPLLFNLHGGGGTIASHIGIADMSPIADTANFIVVYPQARQTQVMETLSTGLLKSQALLMMCPFLVH